MLKNHGATFLFKDGYNMKSVKKNLLEETMDLLAKYTYKVRYVPHETIEDYNATYNVTCENKHITTGAAKELNIPLNEIWVSEMWKPYEKYILFHELREIYYRAKGLSRDEAHKKAIRDGFIQWENDPLLQKLITEIKEMDKKTMEKKKNLIDKGE
jgi:competence protein ComEA